MNQIFLFIACLGAVFVANSNTSAAPILDNLVNPSGLCFWIFNRQPAPQPVTMVILVPTASAAPAPTQAAATPPATTAPPVAAEATTEAAP